MKVLRNVRGIKLNEGNLQAKGLFNLSIGKDTSLAVSYWFDEETKDRLMKLDDAKFWHESREIIKENNVI